MPVLSEEFRNLIRYRGTGVGVVVRGGGNYLSGVCIFNTQKMHLTLKARSDLHKSHAFSQ